MKLCAVQLASLKGDLPGNLQRHLVCIEQAAALGAELVVFPELSLTGYEPSVARQSALPVTSARLDPLQAACDRLGITVAVGLPLPTPDGIRIGMPIFCPEAPRQAYAKQRLHDDELPYFTPGDQALLLEVGEHRVAPAICYESMFMAHAAVARERGADLYLVSVAKTAKGIREGYAHYPEVARELGMPVLMANCVGPADTFIGAGGSAAWDSQGHLLASLDDHSEGLIVLDTRSASAITLPLAPYLA
ncbi:Nitrilase/cyanide hydratase and apolipoprotein N-acyltransferase [Pseudomonas putida TRO1]|uniref:Nitrilase/cyanide hydratase and apolipoprotein N-acyltransferase n=1 Tax=Pseudomonas putida TRO1 TaxID=1227924 RepID=A0AAD2W844_PSEPU|nr:MULTISPECIES: carbon-nitrogen hydrolase family protein [Pseudomonas]ELS0927661.1 carbon-nitrogen hydrolase family protein [Pseudomonas putida]ENY75894.1 Nitrilase/cyanide hydratase and apolipoprotein N-acyltransferase [Pseudomonas putida TRO1]PKF27339.1 carbon-nitrogen hydrolase family protein [Pseudomonas hunanensis]UWH20471.1 carbon-nitrogen hydrolase family protein [Pseudomonas sp. HD6515]HDS0937330.1 carbon-nitrogen hydrolase family protein [Pseudomonas putida]